MSKASRYSYMRAFHQEPSSSHGGDNIDYTPYDRKRETDDSSDTTTNSTEESLDSTDTNSITEDEEEFDAEQNLGLWVTLVIMCYNKRCKAIDVLKEYILLYIESESDKLFQDIMNDIAGAAELPLHDAIEYSIDKHEKSIIASVNICKANSFWCELAEMDGGLNCQWLTGKICSCGDCVCGSLLETVEVLIKLFTAMREDDLIRQIEADVAETGEEMALEDAIDRTVERYERDILARFRSAEDFANVCR